MNDIILKDFYKADIFRFDLEKQNSMIELTINDSISWDYIKMKLTREELQGLSDFIAKFLES